MKLSRHESHQCFYFDCKYVSPFDDEFEYLFFGGDSILRINTIRDIKNNGADYKYYLQSVNCLLRIIKGIGFNENTIKNKSKKILNKLCLYKTENVVNIPQYILNVLDHHTSNTPNEISLNFIEIREKYKFLKPSFIKSDGLINIRNIWTLFNHTKSIKLVMSNRYEVDEHFMHSIYEEFNGLNVHSTNKSLTMKGYSFTFEFGNKPLSEINKKVFKENTNKFKNIHWIIEMSENCVILKYELPKKPPQPKVIHEPTPIKEEKKDVKVEILTYGYVRICQQLIIDDDNNANTITTIPDSVRMIIIEFTGKREKPLDLSKINIVC